MLERLLEAGLPEEFARRSSVQVAGVIGKLDLDVLMARLPDEQISRLSRGDPIDLVLGEMGMAALQKAVGPALLQAGEGEVGGPGSEAAAEREADAVDGADAADGGEA